MLPKSPCGPVTVPAWRAARSSELTVNSLKRGSQLKERGGSFNFGGIAEFLQDLVLGEVLWAEALVRSAPGIH